MDANKSFVEIQRESLEKRPVENRVRDYREIYLEPDAHHFAEQASRCMDCGVPYCHAAGCPLDNLVPEFNSLVARGRWREACDLLHSTNNFPEFTGRLCPALCEAACSLGVTSDSVTIREIEREVVERGWREGYIVPRPPKRRTGKRVAVIGSGPAGLAAAQMLNWAGHSVTVYETDDRLGGFLRYGVPDFKLEKWIIDRRVQLLEDEGVVFETRVKIGEDISARYLGMRYDAVCLCAGARAPRDLPLPGRDLDGVHLATTYLAQNNRRQAGDTIAADEAILAKDKVVVVLGGGDTGSDCVGTARRQGARAVHQFEILPRPPEQRTDAEPWPEYPRLLRTSSSHEEGCERRWCIATKEFLGKDGRLTGIRAVEVEWEKDDAGQWRMKEIEGSEFAQECGLALLALGFVHTEHNRLLESMGVELDGRGNVKVDDAFRTTVEKVYAAGDATMGASLIVRAIRAGRDMAAQVDRELKAEGKKTLGG